MSMYSELDFDPESFDNNEANEDHENTLFNNLVMTASNDNTVGNRFPNPFVTSEAARSNDSRLEASARPETGRKVEWAESLSDGFRRAMNENKPLILVFGADWCDKCVTLKKEVLGQPKDKSDPNSKEIPAAAEFNAFDSRAVFVFANPEKDDRFNNVKKKMDELGIIAFPTMVILEVPSMQERARVTGRWDKDTYIKKMEEAFKGRSDAPVTPSAPPRTTA
jgi:thiol-disulfide isomerase/thioredoxin